MTSELDDFVDAVLVGRHSLSSAGNGKPFGVVGIFHDVDDLLERATDETDAGRDVWFGLHRLDDDFAGPGRGGEDDVADVRVLAADLDWDDPAHKAEAGALPSEETVRKVLADLGELRPSIVVATGHGVQAYWLLDETVAPAHGAQLTAQLHQLLADRGLKPEGADLARVLRLPGTTNWKTEPVAVRIESIDTDWRFGYRYLDAHLPKVSAVRSTGAAGHWRALDESQLHPADVVALKALRALGGHSEYVTTKAGETTIHIVRPGKVGTSSAAIGHLSPGKVKVWSSNWPPLRPGGVYSADELLAIVESKAAGAPTPETVEWVLPASFWSARPQLAQIRQAALSRLISPDAVLAAVLVRISVLSHHQFVLPPLVGRIGSLNLYAAIVAAPGMGKGAAIDVARELVPTPMLADGLAGRMRDVPAGSGEGLVRAFYERETEKGEDGKHRVVMNRATWNLLVRIDEGEVLTRLARRQDQTTLTVLRQGWSGERLGATYSDSEKNLSVQDHDYRLCVVMAVQPELARFLLDDAAGGTPQRFTWLSGLNPGLLPIDELPEWPGALSWRTPRRPPTASGHTLVAVDPSIGRELQQTQYERVTGTGSEGERGEHVAHSGLRRLKVAAALALLDERSNVTIDDWRLAGIVETTSAAVLARIAATIRNEDRRRQDALDEMSVRRQEKIAGALEAREAQSVERIAKGIVRRVRRGPAPVALRDVRHAVASRDRQRLADALELAVDAGWITGPDGGPYELGDRAEEVPDAA